MSFGVSTRGFYDRSTSVMTGLQKQADKAMVQISTGKRLQVPSDDPVAYQRLQVLRRASADEAVYGANVKVAQATLQQADTQLDEISTQLQQVTERALRAANGTMSANDRASIAIELRSILETIVAAANVKDARGLPLFGGQGNEPSVTSKPDGSLDFAPGRQTAIPIGDGQAVEPGVSAGEVLKIGNGRDIGAVVTALITSLAAGEAPVDADRADLAALSEQVIQAQTSVGARAARVDLQAGYFATAALEREDTRSGLEDADPAQAITDLKRAMTILEATQASFGKLSQMSLFDYIR